MLSNKAFAAALIAAALMPVAASAQTPDETPIEKPAGSKPDMGFKKEIDIDVKEKPLAAVVDYIRSITGENIVLGLLGFYFHEMPHGQMAVDTTQLVLHPLVIEVGIGALLREALAEKVLVASHTSGVVCECYGALETALALPVDFSDILEKLAVDVLHAQPRLFDIEFKPASWKVTLDAVSDYAALGSEVSRFYPRLGGIRVDVARLIAELIRSGGVNARLPAQQDQESQENSTCQDGQRLALRIDCL